MSTEDKQAIFAKVYRGRQSALHHLAYMRTAKTLLALEVMERAGIVLRGRIMDYGFGAGTFFRNCARDAEVYGVETDPEAVAEVEGMLRRRGYEKVDLRTIDISDWASHSLLSEHYDVILCSHVLEHLRDPTRLLGVLGQCLRPGGRLVCLVPVNEIAPNPHHVQKVDRGLVEAWVRDSGLAMTLYWEGDQIFYPFQPWFAHDTGWRHRVAQGVSLGLGVASAVLGRNLWWRMSSTIGRLFRWPPCQAAFVLTGPDFGGDLP